MKKQVNKLLSNTAMGLMLMIEPFAKNKTKGKLYTVRIIKLTDDMFQGEHPNGIYAGFSTIGKTNKLPTIGERFYVGVGFSTSVVTEELNRDNIFKTMYSTYQLEFIK